MTSINMGLLAVLALVASSLVGGAVYIAAAGHNPVADVAQALGYGHGYGEPMHGHSSGVCDRVQQNKRRIDVDRDIIVVESGNTTYMVITRGMWLNESSNTTIWYTQLLETI